MKIETQGVAVLRCAGGNYTIGADCTQSASGEWQTVICIIRAGENGEPDVEVGEIVDWRRTKTIEGKTL